MNASKEYNVIIWATAGCGSRTITQFLKENGMKDCINYDVGKIAGIEAPFTHTQGVPKGCENYDIVCATRNPYSRCVSSFLDEKAENETSDSPKEYEFTFENWLRNCYFKDNRFPIFVADFYMTEWKEIGRQPKYIIHMENIIEDIRKIPNFDKMEFDPHVVESVVEKNNMMYENKYDEYVGRFQNIVKHYNQDIADLVYEKLKNYFDYFGYHKDSWKTNGL
jgi:hypothetical protein